MGNLLPRPHGTIQGSARLGSIPAWRASRAVRRDIDRPPLRLLPDGDDLQRGRDPASGGTSDSVRSRFRGGLAGGALRRVRAYINEHIGERISLDQLARQAGVSRFHFARQFRLSTGESPMGYLRRVRIERSKCILQARDTTIAEVAASLGFSDQSHFTRIFGRLVGVSPGSFARGDGWSLQAVAGEGA
jgi:AraC family transcriptional regulator